MFDFKNQAPKISRIWERMNFFLIALAFVILIPQTADTEMLVWGYLFLLLFSSSCLSANTIEYMGISFECEAGTLNFKEIVDFGEFVGYDIDFKTGERTATSWGKIHYGASGVHIVPTKPRN